MDRLVSTNASKCKLMDLNLDAADQSDAADAEDDVHHWIINLKTLFEFLNKHPSATYVTAVYSW